MNKLGIKIDSSYDFGSAWSDDARMEKAEPKGDSAVKPARRTFLRLAAGAAALPAASRLTQAQTYPTRPVRIVASAPPGGNYDTLARLLAPRLSERLGQPFIVDNRPGGGTNIGTEMVVRSPADGYTLLVVGPPAAINAALYERLSFNFLHDVAPIAAVFRVPHVIVVHPSVLAKTVPEFIAYSKSNSGKVNMASAGTGTTPHMAGELFKTMAGVHLVHVPYRGEGPAITDLLGGQVQVMFASATASIEQVRAGKLRPLAVTTATRWEGLPDIPTVGDFVPGYEVGAWFGIGAPKNTPDEIVDTLNKEINALLADPKIKGQLAALGGTTLAGWPADFGTLIADETGKWAKVIRAANIKPE